MNCTVFDGDICCHEWKRLVNFSEHFFSMLDLASQSAKNCTDMLVVVVRLSEIVVQIVELLNHKFFLSLGRLPLLDLFANHDVHFGPARGSEQLKNKFLKIKK
jgi:hypothetical protein